MRKATCLAGLAAVLLFGSLCDASLELPGRGNLPGVPTVKARVPESLSGGGRNGSPVNVVDEGDFSIAAIVQGSWGIKDILKEFAVRHTTDPRRRAYLISFVLSAVYAFYFVKGYEPSCPNYADGFCVTNLVEVDGKKVCKSFPPGNSHVWAFGEDIVFTVVSILLPYTKFSAKNIEWPMKVAIPFIILSHGLIHGWISSKGCILPNQVFGMGTLIYTLFTGALTAITFYALSDLPENQPVWRTWTEIILVTAGIVALTIRQVMDGKANPVSALFLASQLLVGYLGAFHPGERATLLVGKTFVFPCVVSLVEYLKCNWLFPIGGHAWYDFFLHISVISALLPSP